MQQSKVKNKPEFLNAFSPIIAEGTEVAYRGSPPNIQDKIRRVVVVWRERSIFAQQIQGGIESRLDGRLAQSANVSVVMVADIQ